jgi:hypothetical protein
MGVVVQSEGTAPERLEVRPQFPRDTSPCQIARWEVKYQIARTPEEGLQLPEASTAQVTRHKMELKASAFWHTQLNPSCESRRPWPS